MQPSPEGGERLIVVAKRQKNPVAGPEKCGSIGLLRHESRPWTAQTLEVDLSS